MERSYVICHILSSLDRKINGPFAADGEPVEFLLNEVERIGGGGLCLNYLTRTEKQS